MFHELEPGVLVAPQIGVAEVAAAKAAGVTLLVNNRPDGEAPGQPAGAAIAAAAAAAGIDYRAVPITLAALAREQVDAMADALAAAGGGRVLAFCRSGTRSTYLWALARAAGGGDPAALAQAAADAGYDLAPIAGALAGLAAEARGAG